ncbi:hypothetical protein Lal_00001327 [Lupinus albus]|nr:hypothetical protein Lal_00001327 [Lupinus albus]
MTNEPCVAVLSEVNMVGGYDRWWVDTGTSHHVFYNCAIFKIYTDDYDKKVLFGYSHTTIVSRTSDVELICNAHSKDEKNSVSSFLLSNASATQRQ